MLINKARKEKLNITTVGDIVKYSKLYELESIALLSESKELVQVAKDKIEERNNIYSRLMGVPRNIDGFYSSTSIVNELEK